MLSKAVIACALMLLSVDFSLGTDHPSVSTVPALPATTRGQTVTVQGDNFPAKGVEVFLRRGTEKPRR